MSEFKPIKNMKELQKEKGIYYPYIMQLMEAPVINGILVCETTLNRFPKTYIHGIAETLLMIYNKRTNKKIFE